AGSTTTASFFLRLTTASGEKHTGTRGTGVTITPSASGHAFHVQDDYTEILNLEITHSSPASSNEGIRVQADNVLVDSCLIYKFDQVDGDGIYMGSWGVNNLIVRNCIIIDCFRAGIHFQQWSAVAGFTHDADIVNVTIIRCGWGIGVVDNHADDVITADLYNNLLVENTEDMGQVSGGDSGTVTFSGDYNIYDLDPDGYVPGGNSINLATGRVSDDLGDFTSGNWVFFVNLTVDAEDLHLQGTSTENCAIEGGVGPASQALVPTSDIDGDTRSGSVADVGADEYIRYMPKYPPRRHPYRNLLLRL
ncbi:MAG: right-handed parallel beta-helix repeat-containing protein, partial [Planctomycetota bacterium]